MRGRRCRRTGTSKPLGPNAIHIKPTAPPQPPSLLPPYPHPQALHSHPVPTTHACQNLYTWPPLQGASHSQCPPSSRTLDGCHLTFPHFLLPPPAWRAAAHPHHLQPTHTCNPPMATPTLLPGQALFLSAAFWHAGPLPCPPFRPLPHPTGAGRCRGCALPTPYRAPSLPCPPWRCSQVSLPLLQAALPTLAAAYLPPHRTALLHGQRTTYGAFAALHPAPQQPPFMKRLLASAVGGITTWRTRALGAAVPCCSAPPPRSACAIALRHLPTRGSGTTAALRHAYTVRHHSFTLYGGHLLAGFPHCRGAWDVRVAVLHAACTCAQTRLFPYLVGTTAARGARTLHHLRMPRHLRAIAVMLLPGFYPPTLLPGG